MTKYSEEDLAKLRKIREDNPEFAATLDEFRKQFPGMKITYLKSGDVEFGKKSPEGVVPCLSGDYQQYQPVLEKELSVYEKARIQVQAMKRKR